MTKRKDWPRWTPEKNNVLPLNIPGAAPPSPGDTIMTTDKMKRAEYRARQGMESWLPVSHVAKDWGVSTRRVRVLLDGGRLDGRKQENGYWEVKFPYSITTGTRGPASRREVKKVERMQDRLK